MPRPAEPAAPRSVEARAVEAAQAALVRQRYASAVDVLLGLGWLAPSHLDEWRQGRLECLERALQVSPLKLSRAMAALGDWARARGLAAPEISRVARTTDRRALRFTAGGDPEVERAYRTHWVSPDLSDAARERLRARLERPPDLVVVSPLHEDWSCTGCRGTGRFLVMETEGPRCLACAGLGHLVYVPSGDAALTRRAKALSALSAVVVRWSRARRRYERRGVLVEAAALREAEAAGLGDAEARGTPRGRQASGRGKDAETRKADQYGRPGGGRPGPA